MSKVTKALKKAQQNRLNQFSDEELEEIFNAIDSGSYEQVSQQDLAEALKKLSSKYFDLQHALEKKENVYQTLFSDKDEIIKNLKFFQNKRKEDINALKEKVDFLQQQVNEKDSQLINQANLVKRLNHITAKFLELERNIDSK